LIRGTNTDEYTISLSTAHPCKFSKAVDDALGGIEGYDWDDIIPKDVKELLEGKENRVMYIPKADAELVKKAIMENVS
jgi:threonine synthase